jgi:hypothetical protein
VLLDRPEQNNIILRFIWGDSTSMRDNSWNIDARVIKCKPYNTGLLVLIKK